MVDTLQAVMPTAKEAARSKASTFFMMISPYLDPLFGDVLYVPPSAYMVTEKKGRNKMKNHRKQGKKPF